MDRVAAAMRVAGVGLRLHILTEVAERGPLSPSDYAERGDVPLREAAYHFRGLRDGGLIALEHLRTSGGTAQHFYAVTPMGRAIVEALPEFARVAPPRRTRGKPQA